MNQLFQVGKAPILRPYQQRAVTMVEDAYASGACAPLLELATGSGKTVIASELIRRQSEAGHVSLFLAPRRELVLQASRSLANAGVSHGVLMAGRDDLLSPQSPVQVASVDTILSRVVRQRRQAFMDPAFIVVDECHLSVTKKRVELLSRWSDARLLGLTATPSRKDGKALGVLYDRLLKPVSISDLTRAGFLAPARYFSISEPDLRRVGTVAGDYNQGQLDEAVNQPQLVGDIVQTWLERAGDRRTVVFATSIEHSVALADAFKRSGVAAEHVDATTPTDRREQIFKRFSAGDAQVLTNCFLASYGFDLPELSCVVLARPTKSLVLYLQMIGRGLRTADGKKDCLVLDHSGAVHHHGFAVEERTFTLNGDRALDGPRKKKPGDKREAKQIDCPECQAVFTGTRICPECGYELVPKGKEVRTAEGELIEIGSGMPQAAIDRLEFYG